MHVLYSLCRLEGTATYLPLLHPLVSFIFESSASTAHEKNLVLL